MSFLAGGRLAARETAYFIQESKQAVSRLSHKHNNNSNNNNNNNNNNSSSSWSLLHDREAQADVLPEVLRHSLPSKIFEAPSDSTLSVSSKWVLPQNPPPLSPPMLSTLSGLICLCPKIAIRPTMLYGSECWAIKQQQLHKINVAEMRMLRWQLPESEHSVLASTANDLRQDRYTPINNSKKVEAAAEALSQIGKAFFIATTIVFGGAALTFAWTASKLDMNNIDGMKTKVHDLAQPKFETIKEQLVPLRTWTKNTAKKWHIEREEKMKENPLIKELSKQLGAKTSD
ncbi:hypothetical protein Scep_028824 [Stephania cephalantha]|uniref:Uncharacterized protein n=1 Tax=Stephania cephalantha TaxID=152367 RepID=A0AAP0HM61_9MAGN